MSVIVLVIILLFLAGILWVVNVKVPGINPTIKWVITAVVLIVAVILCLSALAIWDQVRDVKVPRL